MENICETDKFLVWNETATRNKRGDDEDDELPYLKRS